MSERLIFGVTPAPPGADKRRGMTYQERHRAALLAGTHPLTGYPLRTDGTRCGSCRHLILITYARTYRKCGKASMTCGAATDCRLRWPACALYEPTTPAAPQEHVWAAH